MRVNADLSLRAAVHPQAKGWTPSPVPKVDRLMLDRIGEEVGRATSLVRYAPGSRFTPHVHGGGEEFLVLDGIFQDEHGSYPQGTYVRNPPGSRHAPSSAVGCTIFVKLWQFRPNDETQLVCDTEALTLTPASGLHGAKRAILHHDDMETVCIENWAAGAAIRAPVTGGIEILCLEGSFLEAGEEFGRWSWLRLPAGARLDVLAGPKGARVWCKSRHLAPLATGWDEVSRDPIVSSHNTQKSHD